MNRLLALYQTLLGWHEGIAVAHEENDMALTPAAQTEMDAYARVLHHLDEILAADFTALQAHFEPAPASLEGDGIDASDACSQA